MKAIIGDIGNTITKICLINDFKIEKIIYFNSNKILFNSFLKKKFKKMIKKKNFRKSALFSSVVPKYQFILKRFLKFSVVFFIITSDGRFFILDNFSIV